MSLSDELRDAFLTGGSDLQDAADKLEAFLTRKPTGEGKPTARVRPFKRVAGGR